MLLPVDDASTDESMDIDQTLGRTGGLSVVTSLVTVDTRADESAN